MTYSYSLPVDPFDGLPERIIEAAEAVPEGVGRLEAKAHVASVGFAVGAFAQLVPPAEDKAKHPRIASVSGHGDASSASLSVTVYLPPVTIGQAPA